MDENNTTPVPEEEKKSNKERIKEITDSIEAGIKDLFDSEKYRNYLRTMSRFHNYSVNNVMLIHMQAPNATRVAGFNKWRDSFGRHVKKGERGIKIIAPAFFKKKIEEMKLDPETQAPMVDKNGEVIMEEKEIKIPMYKVVHVYDVAQTYGKPLPQLASTLTGDVKQYEIFMEAIRRSAPVPIETKELRENLDGYFSLSDQTITLRAGMSEVQTVCAAIHEITHALLHNTQDKDAEKIKSQKVQELEAESVAFSVCAYYGIETGENSFGYLASYAGSDTKDLRASLETINHTANRLITDIDRHFAEICKERGIDPKEQQSEPMAQEALFLLDDSIYLHIKRHSEDIDYDYTLYTAETMKRIDSGATELPEDSTLIGATLAEAAKEIMVDAGIPYTSLEPVSLDKLTEIEAANEVAAARELAAPEPLRPLDQYPMPDAGIAADAVEAMGYMDGDLLPLTRDRAAEYLEEGYTVYAVTEGGETVMCMDEQDIRDQPSEAVMSALREEWEDSNTFQERVQDRLGQQESREAAFFAYPRDCFAIYQLDGTPEASDRRFQSLDDLDRSGQRPEREMYDLIYTGELGDKSLEDIFYEFNMERPADFGGYSLSASDVVAISRGGKITYHYCDRIGFKELPDFLPDNPLKSAEMSLEDDYNMVDGIINNGPKQPTVEELEQQAKSGQPISLLDLANAVHREQSEKVPPKQERRLQKSASIYDRLRQTVPQPHTPRKSAPKKSAEMEL